MSHERHDYYRFAKVSDNIWKGYGPGTITTFTGEAAEAMDAWNNYVTKCNKKNPDSPIDRTNYFNYMIAEVW